MKLIFALFFMLIAMGCQQNSSNFETVSCNPADSIPNNNLRKVFKPCRQYIYQAKYWDSQYNLISDELIWMMATGKGWNYQPELQDEIEIQYSFDSSKKSFIEGFNINESRNFIDWDKKVTTGIIEMDSFVWMHPFRQNQYFFTQVAGFPEIYLPIKAGKSWTSKINIHVGWGDWENSTVLTTYQILNLETVDVPFKKLDAWHVSATTVAEYGTTQNDFWYSEEFGFIKMTIKNYKGQLLSIELKEVIEG
jgi:hypothetical protein